jgi:XTP/dITP diphosphohydrolase
MKEPIVRLHVASSNPGKPREYQELAAGNSHAVEIDLLPGFRDLPGYEENGTTFAEIAAGKALHFSRFSPEPVFADDSGLVVPALGGEPGVRSARYAGAHATDADRYRKLLEAMRGKTGDERRARFVCVLAMAHQGRAIAVFSDAAQGTIAESPRGDGGFGYDPVFYFEKLGHTYAEITREQKNEYSHRGRCFRKLLQFLHDPDSVP